MRTKTLLLTAVLSAAGVASSMAQVFSVNTVGYINLTLAPGFSIIANQLNAGGNTVADVLPGVPDGTQLYKFNGTSYDGNTFDFGAWTVPTMPLKPGEGAFIRNAGTANVTITLVGEVPQGALSTTLNRGLNLVSSQVPQAGQLDTVLGFPAADGDQIFRFNPATQGYIISTFDFGAWDNPPAPAVGEGFFVNKTAQTTWTRNFSTN